MWATVRACLGSARAGRCKFCHKPVVWIVTDAGKNLPMDLGFTVREIVRDPRTGIRFQVLDKDDRHDCPARRKKFRGQPANNGSHERPLR